jgi:hypothetical protein
LRTHLLISLDYVSDVLSAEIVEAVNMLLHEALDLQEGGHCARTQVGLELATTNPPAKSLFDLPARIYFS